MSIPGQTLTVNDPGMGTVEPAPTTPLFVGIASSGTAAELNTFNSIADVVAEYGQGPMVEDACTHLALCGGPIKCMRCTENAAGSCGSVSQSGAGPLPTVTAQEPYDAYEVHIQIVVGGALGAATFKYSLDDGRTWSEVLTVPAGGTYALTNTNVTVTFPSGTYVAEELYEFDCVAPTYTTTELATCATALSASSEEWAYIVLCGVHATASAANTLAGGLSGHITTWASEFRFVCAIMDAGGDNTTTTLSGFTTEDSYLSAAYGRVDMLTHKPFTGWAQPKRGAYVQELIKAGQAVLSEDLARVASGSLSGIAAESTTHGVPVSHDEFRTEVMDAGKFTTLRSFPGRIGYYLTNGRMRAALGSDFQYWQFARIICTSLRRVFIEQSLLVNASFRTNSDGTVDERDAAAVEAKIQRALELELLEPYNAEGTRGHVSALAYTIDRDHDLNGDSTLYTELAIRPLGYAKWIVTKVGFALNV